MSQIEDFYKGKCLLVTGGSGSIGSLVCKELSEKYKVAEIKVVSNDPVELKKFKEDVDRNSKFSFYNIDIRNQKKLCSIFEGTDLVIHAAAFKYTPEAEALRDITYSINVEGTKNVIHCSTDHKVKKVTLLSTDKEVNPYGFMGKTKRLAELLMMIANEGNSDTVFSTIRFGNVLGTVGSVVPIVKTQIRKGEPITLTNPNMTRPFMSIEQAIELVIKILFISEGGEIIMRKMPRFRTGDLINLLIKHYAKEPDKVKIKNIGRRPGEKMHEETHYDYEKDFAHIHDNDIIVINFAKKGNILKMERPLLSEEQLEEVLKKFKII